MRRALPLLFLSVLFVQVLFAGDRAAAPEGFTWQEVPELKTAVLKPTGWFYKHEVTHGHPAYYITKESLDNNQEFRTGLTVFVYYKKKWAAEYAQKVIDKYATRAHAEKWAKDVGSLKEFGVQAKHAFADGNEEDRTLMVANPKTNTVYLIVFESPESDWDAAWKMGATVVDSLVFDDSM